jgi:hypothetical protein
MGVINEIALIFPNHSNTKLPEIISEASVTVLFSAYVRHELVPRDTVLETIN